MQMVDARTGIEHRLTPDAVTAGRKPTGQYIARCGDDVLPAALIAQPDRLRRTCIRLPAQRAESPS
ncbi:MAG: hypothetical protein ACRDRA_07880 [Pseudonocardiaceae bacterium]